MALKFYAPTEADPGELFVWREDGADKVSLRVRRLPPAEERRIDSKHFGHKRRITYATKGVQQDLDIEAQGKANTEKAAYCLVDSEGFDLEVAGPEAAQRLGALLGEKLELGQVIRLDGRWTDALKALVFASLPDLVDFIGGRARKLRGEDEAAEEEREKN